jgi:hypothetical protein
MRPPETNGRYLVQAYCFLQNHPEDDRRISRRVDVGLINDLDVLLKFLAH